VQTTGVLYLDASALVKLVVAERESAALREALRQWPRGASSVVARVELRLAAARSATATARERAERVLESTSAVAMDRGVIERAGRLSPLRALDAIHLASALSLGEALGAFVAYDRRLGRAAESAGVLVLAPGITTA